MMEITALLMAAELALKLATTPSILPKVSPVAPTSTIALGMTKTDVIRAIGEPYSAGYSMYSGDYMSYRGSMCAEGTCQVWLRDGAHVSSTRGMK